MITNSAKAEIAFEAFDVDVLICESPEFAISLVSSVAPRKEPARPPNVWVA